MKSKSEGFSLLEVLIALLILKVALLGLALIIPVAVQANQRNRVDAEGAMLTQRELEQMLAQPLTSASFTDGCGNLVSIVPGGAPLANGRVDFGAAAVANYTADFTGSSGARFQLRWNVQSVADGGKVFTVGARRTGPQRMLLPPVNVWGRQGR